MRLYFMRSTNPFRIGRNGITFRKAEYYHPDMALLKGKRVYIRYRDEDPERIWLYDTDDRYLGEAERITALPAITATAEELDAEQARKARERKAVITHPSYQAAKNAQPLTPADITELYRVCGGTAADVKPSKVVELVTLPKTGKESVQAMRATGTDDVNPFALMATAKIEKRRKSG